MLLAPISQASLSKQIRKAQWQKWSSLFKDGSVTKAQHIYVICDNCIPLTLLFGIDLAVVH